MLDLRPILFAIGLMTLVLGLAMAVCMAVDVGMGSERWPLFAISAGGASTLGGGLALLSRGAPPSTGQREAFLLTVLVWVVLNAVAAVPFWFAGFSLTDGVFEAVSGLTTTGATIMTGLDQTQPGLLLWRAILQWIGGIGIIVTAIAILPSLRVGGMQLFQIESSDNSGKFLPRVGEIAVQTGLVYVALTLLCAALYLANGMGAFDSVAHAMTTMSAGGYGTRDSSFAEFGNGAVSVAILFMILAGLPFARFVLLVRGQPRSFWSDPQIRLFLLIIIAATALLLVYASGPTGSAVFSGPGEALRTTVFNVVSILTGTGYANAPYDSWGPGAVMVFLILMFLGGCAGSAACGIKMFRIEISVKTVFAYAARMTRPDAVVPVRYNGNVVDPSVLQSVMVFVFLYFATFAVAAVLLGLTGLDAVTAISGAATSVSNVGPGLGPLIGPSGTFQLLPDTAKWICLTAMLLGRLEFVTVLVVLSRRFWLA